MMRRKIPQSAKRLVYFPKHVCCTGGYGRTSSVALMPGLSSTLSLPITDSEHCT
jgi:hypothetical protein